MIRVAVIDDEPLARAGVIARLQSHADIQVVGEFGDGIEALQALPALQPQLAFIDVQMPGLRGTDLLARLPAAQRPLAILLTAYDHFAVRAFELNAIDYLLKPIDDERFVQALERARAALPYRLAAASNATAVPEYRRRFQVRVGRRVVLVDADAVDWIEADGDYAVLHAGGESYPLRESLQRLSQELDPACFLRVHRSTIVRTALVDGLQRLSNRDVMLRLRDGTPLRASRTYVDALITALALHGGSR